MGLTWVGPLLLGFDPKKVLEDPSRTAWGDLPRHRDEDQVRLDVERAFVNYPLSGSLRVRVSGWRADLRQMYPPWPRNNSENNSKTLSPKSSAAIPC